MNYLIARVSQPEQKKALPAQKKKLYDYAEKKEWVEGKDYVYIEYDETAFKEDRVKFREVVIEPLLKEKELAIVVWDKSDRFTRDSTSDERIAITKLFRSGKIELHFISDNLFIHKDSPAADLFRLEIGVSLAGYYSAAIRDNVKRRRSQMLRDGIWPGRAPIGYVNYHEVDENGKVIFKGIKVDAARAHHIHRGFELRSTGLPYRAIAKQLKKDGLRSNTKTNKAITTAQWEQILDNPFYMGEMREQGKLYKHTYPPIIEPWLWDKVQEVKSRRANGKTKYNSKPFLFKTAKCKTCGYSITFDGPKNGGNIYGKCTEYGGKHGAKWVNEKKLLDQVRAGFKSFKVPEFMLPELVAAIEVDQAGEQEHYIGNKTRLQSEFDCLDKEVQDLFDDRKQFKSHPEMFERMVKDRSDRQKMILEELEDHSNGDKAYVIGASYILDICSRADTLFDAESSKLEQKRYLIDFVLTNIMLDGEKLEFTLKEPFDAIAAMALSQEWYTRQDSNLRPLAPQANALSS
jgi:site-specific DNA recombinase